MSSRVALPSREEIARREATVTVLGEITAAMIGRFAMVVGESNPLYFDDAYARAHGYPGIVAPPSYLAAVLGWGDGPREEALMADGSDPALVLPETVGHRFMGGGQALEFFAPVCAGDTVTARKRLADVYERQASSGTLIFMVSETVFQNQRGENLMRCRETLIASASETSTS
jgi:acyl dehydratase